MRVACSNLCSEIPLSAAGRRDGAGGRGCAPLEPGEPAIAAIVSGTGLKRPQLGPEGSKWKEKQAPPNLLMLQEG